MDLLASALLLAAFVLFVDLTFGEGSHVAAQLGGLFSSDATLGWPAGIQEDDHPWLVLHRASVLTTATDGWTPPTRSLRAQASGVTDPGLDGSSPAPWWVSTIEEIDEPVRTQRVDGGLITGAHFRVGSSAVAERVSVRPALGRARGNA